MGYKKRRREFVLKFPEDHELHGLEISVTSMTLGEVRDLRAEAENMDGEQFAMHELGAFVGRITGWNLEDEDGKTLDISVESLLTLEAGDVRSIIGAYSSAALGQQVAPPLSDSSTSGDASLEASLPMAVS